MRPLGMLLVAWALWAGGCSGDGGATATSDDSLPATAEGPTTSSDPATPTSTAPPTPPSTIHDPSSIEGQIEADYLATWDAFARAMAGADEAHLEDAFADKALQYRTTDVERVRAQGLAARIEVEHDYDIEQLTDTRAAVVDDLVNHMRLVDPSTGAFTEPDPNSPLGRAFTLELRGDRWIVIDINEVP